jgi:hypothetical protein
MNADDVMPMMFLDCPAYLDADGARRCGLPAEVRYRYVVASTGGPVESAVIRCPSGHWFNAPVEFLTCKDGVVRGPGNTGDMLPPTGEPGHYMGCAAVIQRWES